MKFFKDIVIILILFFISLLILVYKFLISGDLPVIITIPEFFCFLLVILMYTTVQYLYIVKSNLKIINLIFLLITAIIWFFILKNSLTTDYFFCNIFCNLIGFFSIFFLSVYSILKIMEEIKK